MQTSQNQYFLTKFSFKLKIFTFDKNTSIKTETSYRRVSTLITGLLKPDLVTRAQKNRSVSTKKAVLFGGKYFALNCSFFLVK